MSNSYVLLEKVVVGSAGASSVTFSNIPQTGYTDLKVVASARTDATRASNGMLFDVRPNGSSTGLTRRSVYGESGAAASASGSDSYAVVTNTSDYTANTFSNAEIYIPNYTGSTNKSMSADSVTETNSTAGLQMLGAMLWSNTAAITSLQFTPLAGNFVANSTFYLYGVAKLGTTPTIAPKATGGDVIDTDGTYWYHIFRSSGTFTPATALTCDYLVVAGGGGGGSEFAGGGGAGGFRTGSGLSLGTIDYTVTVGAGGAGGAGGTGSVSNNGTSGGNSTFSTITSAGGGYGAKSDGLAGGSGGSGGGSGRGSTVGGTGNVPSQTPSQGNNGGTAGGRDPNGGGGGGASAVGSNSPSNGTGGAGGAGTASTFTGTSVTYAGGGGGAGYAQIGGGGGAGGAGGGGNANSNAVGSNGTANTGGGGGAGTYNPVPNPVLSYAGGSGGSGIVVVRYLVA